MARVIWIEILTRSGQVTARHRCTGPTLSIGRSYRNDVIIDDPTVAPDHLRATQSDDGAILVETATAGSAFSIHGETRERSLVDGDTVLRIGHTFLRLRDETYQVPAAASVVEPKSYWIELSALIALTLAINGLIIWLNETSKPKLIADLGSLATVAGAALVWSGLWAVLSRIFAGAARFGRHLGIASGAFLVYTLYSVLAEMAAFSFSSGTIAGNFGAGIWLVLGVACFLHLQIIAPSHRLRRAAIIATIVVIAIAVQIVGQVQQLKNGQQPVIARTEFPPAFRLARPKSGDQFFTAVGGLQAKLEADREAAAAAP